MAIHVADLFYDRLFELDPSLEALFPEDLAAQRPRFMNAVGAAVAGLDDPETMRIGLRDIKRQNLSLDIQPGHYDTLGEALLWTFEQSLAEEFTPMVKDAWASLCTFIASGMLAGPESRELYKPLERTQLAV